MSATRTIDPAAVLVPEPSLAEQAHTIDGLLRQTAAGAAVLHLADGGSIPLPAELVDALRQVAAILATGRPVAVNAISRELSTSEAAGMLGMSRPTLIRLLDTDQIPSHRVGSHRRVRVTDVLRYRRQQLQQRRRAYEELMLESDALGIDE